jgi:hypothetical protein
MPASHPSPLLIFKNEYAEPISRNHPQSDTRRNLEDAYGCLERGHDGGGDVGAGAAERLFAGQAAQAKSLAEVKRLAMEAAKRLLAFAEVNHLLLHAESFRHLVLERRIEIGAGSEHTVHLDPPTRRVIKVTHADNFGDGAVGQSFSVLDYLFGLKLQNELFRDDIRLEGLVEYEGELPRVVISQPFVKGRRATAGEVAAYLAGRGFGRQLDGSWFNETLRLRVADAVPDNVFAIDSSGRAFVATIDVQVTPDAQWV